MCSVGGRDVLDGADDAVLGVAVDVTAGVTVDVTAAVVMLVVLVCGCVAAPGPVDSPVGRANTYQSTHLIAHTDTHDPGSNKLLQRLSHLPWPKH